MGIFLDILLKPPQPLMGLFLMIEINITLSYEALRVTSSHFEGSFFTFKVKSKQVLNNC